MQRRSVLKWMAAGVAGGVSASAQTLARPETGAAKLRVLLAVPEHFGERSIVLREPKTSCANRKPIQLTSSLKTFRTGRKTSGTTGVRGGAKIWPLKLPTRRAENKLSSGP